MRNKINKEKYFKILSITLGVLIGLLFGEIGCRVYYFGLDGFSCKKVNSFNHLSVSGYVKSAENNNVLYELKPNIDAFFKMKKFKTNSNNLRDKEYTLIKQQNTVRGIVIGDSFTMGSGVNIENVYHSIVEEKLNQTSIGHKYELLNFGVAGYNLLNYLGLLETKTLKYDPDFILIGYCANNDFKKPNRKHLEGNYKVKDKFGAQSYLKKLIVKSFDLENKSKNKERNKEKDIEFMDAMFREFKKFSSEHNIPILLNYLAFSNSTENFKIVKELAKKHDLYFADLSLDFDKNDITQYYVNKKLDAHPNELANSIFANSLLQFQPFLEIIKL